MASRRPPIADVARVPAGHALSFRPMIQQAGAAVPSFEMQIEAFGWGAKEFEGYTVVLLLPANDAWIAACCLS
jgi:hypothetical protein